MSKETPIAELRFMLLFLSLNALANETEGGLGAHFNAADAEEVTKLYHHLKVMVKDMARASATGHRLARERIEQEEKNALERQIPPGEQKPSRENLKET